MLRKRDRKADLREEVGTHADRHPVVKDAGGGRMPVRHGDGCGVVVWWCGGGAVGVSVGVLAGMTRRGDSRYGER